MSERLIIYSGGLTKRAIEITDGIPYFDSGTLTSAKPGTSGNFVISYDSGGAITFKTTDTILNTYKFSGKNLDISKNNGMLGINGANNFDIISYPTTDGYYMLQTSGSTKKWTSHNNVSVNGGNLWTASGGNANSLASQTNVIPFIGSDSYWKALSLPGDAGSYVLNRDSSGNVTFAAASAGAVNNFDFDTVELTLKSTASTIGSSATRITTDSLDSGELPRVTIGSKYLVVMDFNIYVPDLSRLMDYTGSSPVCVSTYLYESGGSSILVNEHPVSRVDNWTHVTAISTLVATKGTISPEFSTASEVIQGTAKISGKITMHFISIE